MGFSMNLRNPLKSGEIRRNSRKIRVARGETLRFPAWVRNSQNSSVHPPAKIRKFAHFVERQGKVSTLPKSGEMHILVKDRGKTGTCVKTTENPRKFPHFDGDPAGTRSRGALGQPPLLISGDRAARPHRLLRKPMVDAETLMKLSGNCPRTRGIPHPALRTTANNTWI